MLVQAEYADAKRVVNILDTCNYDNSYIKHDFYLHEIDIDIIHKYIFDFRILFFFYDKKIFGIKLPIQSERQDLIEVVIANNDYVLWKSVLRKLKEMSDDFGWNFLRVTVLDTGNQNHIIKLIKKLNIEEIALYPLTLNYWKIRVYETELGGSEYD